MENDDEVAYYLNAENRCKSIDEFLETYPPSTTLFGKKAGKIKRIAVINKKASGKPEVSRDLKDYVKGRRATISHSTLLDMAIKEEILEGFWFIICDSKVLDKVWKCFVTKMFFSEIEGSENCTQIQCGKDDNSREGIIFIYNRSILDTEIIDILLNVCKHAIDAQNIGNLIHKPLYYKPAFYTAAGVYYDQNASTKSYIIKCKLMSIGRYSLDYLHLPEVKEWYAKRN